MSIGHIQMLSTQPIPVDHFTNVGVYTSAPMTNPQRLICRVILNAAIFAALSVLAVSPCPQAMMPTPPAVEYYRLVPGFLPEAKKADGYAAGTVFTALNPWGPDSAQRFSAPCRLRSVGSSRP